MSNQLMMCEPSFLTSLHPSDGSCCHLGPTAVHHCAAARQQWLVARDERLWLHIAARCRDNNLGQLSSSLQVCAYKRLVTYFNGIMITQCLTFYGAWLPDSVGCPTRPPEFTLHFPACLPCYPSYLITFAPIPHLLLILFTIF